MKKILVVDDEDEILTFMSALISQWGYRVDCAYNGEVAEKLLASVNYDLVVTDINMPKCDGITFLTRLKEANNDQFPCKVIVMSGAATTEQCKRVSALAVNEFVLKPIFFREFKQLMDDLLVDDS